MNPRELLAITLGPGFACWLVMSIQTFIALMFGCHPWGEPMATALWVTGFWWATVGAMWLGLVVENVVQNWMRQ